MAAGEPVPPDAEGRLSQKDVSRDASVSKTEDVRDVRGCSGADPRRVHLGTMNVSSLTDFTLATCATAAADQLHQEMDILPSLALQTAVEYGHYRRNLHHRQSMPRSRILTSCRPRRCTNSRTGLSMRCAGAGDPPCRRVPLTLRILAVPEQEEQDLVSIPMLLLRIWRPRLTYLFICACSTSYILQAIRTLSKHEQHRPTISRVIVFSSATNPANLPWRRSPRAGRRKYTQVRLRRIKADPVRLGLRCTVGPVCARLMGTYIGRCQQPRPFFQHLGLGRLLVLTIDVYSTVNIFALASRFKHTLRMDHFDGNRAVSGIARHPAAEEQSSGGWRTANTGAGSHTVASDPPWALPSSPEDNSPAESAAPGTACWVSGHYLVPSFSSQLSLHAACTKVAAGKKRGMFLPRIGLIAIMSGLGWIDSGLHCCLLTVAQRQVLLAPRKSPSQLHSELRAGGTSLI